MRNLFAIAKFLLFLKKHKKNKFLTTPDNTPKRLQNSVLLLIIIKVICKAQN